MFDAAADEPSLLASGDTVRWQAVDRARFAELEALAATGRLDRASLRSAGVAK